MKAISKPIRKPANPWLRIPMMTILSFGILPIVVAIFGFQYLPTSDWASSVSTVAGAAGVSSAALALVAISRSIERGDGSYGHSKWGFEALGLLFTAPLFLFWMGHSAVTSGLPMIVTMLAGKEASVRYHVEHYDGGDKRHCKNPIKLKGLPFLSNELCGFPQSFRDTLSNGSQVLVTGRGSRYGVFPNRVRNLEVIVETGDVVLTIQNSRSLPGSLSGVDLFGDGPRTGTTTVFLTSVGDSIAKFVFRDVFIEANEHSVTEGPVVLDAENRSIFEGTADSVPYVGSNSFRSLPIIVPANVPAAEIVGIRDVNVSVGRGRLIRVHGHEMTITRTGENRIWVALFPIGER